MAKRRKAARPEDAAFGARGRTSPGGQVTPGLPGAPKVGGVRDAAALGPVIVQVGQVALPQLSGGARDRNRTPAARVTVLGPGSAKPPATRDPRARAVAGRRGRR